MHVSKNYLGENWSRASRCQIKAARHSNTDALLRKPYAQPGEKKAVNTQHSTWNIKICFGRFLLGIERETELGSIPRELWQRVPQATWYVIQSKKSRRWNEIPFIQFCRIECFDFGNVMALLPVAARFPKVCMALNWIQTRLCTLLWCLKLNKFFF